MMNLYNKYKEIIKYLFFGGVTTIISLITYYLLTYKLLNPNISLELQIANIISWGISVTIAYYFNYKYVFQVNRKIEIKEIKNFYLARILTLIIDILLMFILVTILRFNDKFMKLIVQMIVIILNYVFSKFFVFKKS